MVSKIVIGVIGLACLLVGAGIGFLIATYGFPGNSEAETQSSLATHYNHAPGPCQLVDGVDIGSEDIVVLSSGQALMTSGMKIWVDVEKPPYAGRRGSVKIFDFNKRADGATDLKILFDEDNFDLENFNPHGMAVWDDSADSGKVYVYVVNHDYIPAMKESVDKFELNEGMRTLTHVRRISDDENMPFLNNLVLTGPDTFFYTNFLTSRVFEEQVHELENRLEVGTVGYFDGSSNRLVADGLVAPNGINISPDGRYIYVAQYGAGKLSTFRRNAADNSLDFQENHETCEGVDNIDVDGEYLWLGCHPDTEALGKQLQDPLGEISPSQTLRLKVEEGHVSDVIEVFYDDGSLFSAITVAVRYEDAILMGSVTKNALHCEAKYIG